MKKYFENINELQFDNLSWKRYFFADVSALAYHDGTKAKREVEKLGFEKYIFLENKGAQCHVFENDNHIIVAFRGTEPDEFSDIKADLLALKRKSRTEGQVHLGFKLEIRKLWSNLEPWLLKNKNKKLWITGHSLGGALATICASRLEERSPTVFTYGSPRVGCKEFVKGMDVKHHRVVNNNDIVPSVPLWLMGFRHHGTLTYINYYGNIRDLTLWQRVKDQLRGRWRALKKKQLFDGVYDHNIAEYAEKLKSNVVLDSK